MTTIPDSMTGKRVLVAEDEYFIARTLVRDLRAAGADVVGPAATVTDALDLVRAGAIDGAVLDINLRGEMAFAVADALVECGVPFVFASGYSADIVPERHTSIALCEKPVDLGAIARALFNQRVEQSSTVENVVFPQHTWGDGPARPCCSDRSIGRVSGPG